MEKKTPDRDDPTQARAFTAEEAQRYAVGDPGAPTMLRMPREMARVIAENLEAFATHEDAVGALSTTEHGKRSAHDRAVALRAYATGLMNAST